MRVLVVSHNPFDTTNNMGRTLKSQFANFTSSELAQLYFVDTPPDIENCRDFYCISDADVVKSVYTRKAAGHPVMQFSQMPEKKTDSAAHIEAKIKKQVNRGSLVFIARNMVWSLGRWKTKQLDQWLNEIAPDVIYYASGDYAFSYKVTRHIAKKRNIPVLIGCYDDFYINKPKPWQVLRQIVYADLMVNARKLFKISSGFFGLSEMMTEDYRKLFGKTGYTMYVPSEISAPPTDMIREDRIIYAGNLGHGRAEQLVKLGRALKALGRSDIRHIDVYSGEIREELTGLMCEENGIIFHGRIPAESVQTLMLSSKYVIHTESFDEAYKKRVKYSVSTKLADCLSCGACIVAFGPEEVASIDYLRKANAAWIISDQDQIGTKLMELFDSAQIRNRLIAKAMTLAKENHTDDGQCRMFRETILKLCKKQ